MKALVGKEVSQSVKILLNSYKEKLIISQSIRIIVIKVEQQWSHTPADILAGI